MAESPSKGVIILMVGLPGAGKTTLCRELAKKLSENGSILLKLVSYDDILNDREAWGQADFCWKSERRTVYENVATWLRDTLKDTVSTADDPSFSSAKKSVWLVIDDNMYYRSMRYPYFQLARECHMAYTQIYISCPLEIAIQNNRSRPTSEGVPSEIIERMSTRLQVPDSSEHSWEKCTIIVDDIGKTVDSNELKNLLKQLWTISQNAAPPLSVVDLEEKERQRQMTRESQLHQTDLLLRRIVGEYCKNDKNIQGAKKYNNEVFRQTRQRLLERMKSGHLDVTSLFVDVEALRIIFADFLEQQSDT